MEGTCAMGRAGATGSPPCWCALPTPPMPSASHHHQLRPAAGFSSSAPSCCTSCPYQRASRVSLLSGHQLLAGNVGYAGHGQTLDPMPVPHRQGSPGTGWGLLVSIKGGWLCFSLCWKGIWMLRGQKDCQMCTRLGNR